MCSYYYRIMDGDVWPEAYVYTRILNFIHHVFSFYLVICMQ